MNLFDLIPGLRHVDPEALESYERGMIEVVPAIVRAVDKRRALADEARRRILIRKLSKDPQQ